VWLIVVVVCVVAATLRSRTIGSCQSTATSRVVQSQKVAVQLSLLAIVERGWSRHRISGAIEKSDLYLLPFYNLTVIWPRNASECISSRPRKEIN